MTDKTFTINDKQHAAIDQRLEALDPDEGTWPTGDQIQAIADGLLNTLSLTTLIIIHKHGEEVSVHFTEDGAHKALYYWVVDWWDELDDVDDVSVFTEEEEAVEYYFENYGRESYTLDTWIMLHP